MTREVRAPSGSTGQMSMGIVAHLTTPSVKVMHEEMQREIQNALDLLDETYREILCMRFFENLLPGEIGRLLETSADKVSSAIRRAKNQIRPILRKLM